MTSQRDPVGVVLAEVRDMGPATVAEIAAGTGLSQSTLLIDEKNLSSRDWPWTTQQLCDAYNARKEERHGAHPDHAAR